MQTDVCPQPTPAMTTELSGRRLPAIAFTATSGDLVRLNRLPPRTVLFVYPSIGGPGDPSLLQAWTVVPGARGCTPEACGFRDVMGDFDRAGVSVLGLSSQATGEQGSHAQQLGLPYPLLSDPRLLLRDALGLPTFEFYGVAYYCRVTLLVRDGVIDAVVYPVEAPETAAADALSLARDLWAA